MSTCWGVKNSNANKKIKQSHGIISDLFFKIYVNHMTLYENINFPVQLMM